MKWQGDGVQEQHPPWRDNNPAVYSSACQVIIVMAPPEGATVDFEASWSFHNLCKHFHIATSGWQWIKQFARGKQEKGSSLFYPWPSIFVKRLSNLSACQTVCICWPRCSIDSSGPAVGKDSNLCQTRWTLRWPQMSQSGRSRHCLHG